MIPFYPGLQIEPGEPANACELDYYVKNPPTADPYWASVVLALKFDGTNGSTTFTDSSTAAETLVAGGSAALTTTDPKFGTACLSLNGTTDYVEADAASSNYDFGSGEFTVECWIYSTEAGREQTIIQNLQGATTNGWRLYKTAANQLAYVRYNSGSGASTSTTQTIPLNTWTHVAVSRSTEYGSSNYQRLFINGVDTDAWISGVGALNSSTGLLNIGRSPSTAGREFAGKIDDVRITKGVGRYYGSFNVATAALPTTLDSTYDVHAARTVLMLTAETLADSTIDATKTVSLEGTASRSTLEKKFGAYSFLVPYTGTSVANKVRVEPHQDFVMRDRDWTFELWAYRNANTAIGYLMGGLYRSTDSYIRVTTGGVLEIGVGNSSTAITFTNVATWPLATWVHLVIQRRGESLEIYFQGTLANATSCAGLYFNTNQTSTYPLLLGAQTQGNNSATWNGYIDEVRITRSLARYNTDLTPTAAYPQGSSDPYWSSVVLLCEFDGDFTDASDTPHTMLANGAAAISPTAKYGSGALSLNGSSSWVSTSDALTDFAFGTGDFTVECWFNTSSSNAQTLIDHYQTANTGCWQLYLDNTATYGTQTLAWWSSNATGVKIVGGTTDPRGLGWVHVAVVKRSSRIFLFVNGVCEGSATDTRNYSGGVAALTIGAQTVSRNPAYDFVGNIDGVRITKGVARYFDSFTPPTRRTCTHVIDVDPPDSTPTGPGAIAFAASVRDSLFGIVGTLISSTTLATITCTDAASISASSTVPGLTLAYSTNTLTVSGTPTTSGVYRVVVSYLSSDGTVIRGSTTHEFIIEDAAKEVLVDGVTNAAGRVGRPLAAMVIDLSSNYDVNLGMELTGYVPGCSVALTWDGTDGSVDVTGTPTTAGTFTLAASFVDRLTGTVKASATATVEVSAAYASPPTPAPAPPAPSPPAPAPPPAPTPAPAPGVAADPFFDRVRVLMHMDTQTGLTTDVKGNTFTATGVSQVAGAVREGAQLAGIGSTIYGTVPGLAIVTTPADQMLTVECMCSASLLSLGAQVFEGGRYYCPVVSCVNPDQTLVWSLGFMTDWVYRGINPSVVYYPAFIVRATDGQLDLGNDNGFLYDYQVAALGPKATVGNRMVHLAGMLQYGATSKVAVWWDGGTTGSCVAFDGRLLPPVVPGHQVRIGSAGVPKPGTGSVPLTTASGLMLPITALVPYSGVVDELRITHDDRYASYLSGSTTQAAIPSYARVIPWADS